MIRNKKNYMNLTNKFLIICLLIYGLLFWLQIYFRKFMQYEQPLDFHLWKTNVPFPVSWCSVMEWTIPLLLCMGYVAIWMGCNDIYYTVKGILIISLIEICCGEYGLKQFDFGINDNVLFGLHLGFWKYSHATLGEWIPIYFAGWVFLAVIIFSITPHYLSVLAGKQRQLGIYTAMFYVVCIGEGVLSNIIYFGEYTVYYIFRSILLLCFIFLPLISMPRCNQVAVHCGGEKNKWMKIVIGICILWHIVIWYMGWKTQNYEQIQEYEDVISQSLLYIGKYLIYLCRNYEVIILVVLSLYITDYRSSYNRLVWVTVLYSTTFLVMWYIRVCDNTSLTSVRLTNLCMLGCVACSIGIYFLFRCLWIQSKWTDIIFLTEIYIIVCTGAIAKNVILLNDNKVNWTYCGSIVLYFIMYVISVITKIESKNTRRKKGDGVAHLICILVFLYVLVGVYDCVVELFPSLYVGSAESYSIMWGMHPSSSGFLLLYAIPLYFIITYLAYALKKEKMQIFCTISATAMVLYANLNDAYVVGQLKWYVGVPITLLVALAIVFLFVFVRKIIPKKEIYVGRICIVVTYAMIFYEYVILYFRDRGNIRNVYWRKTPYYTTQVILAILAVIAFAKVGRKTENAI